MKKAVITTGGKQYLVTEGEQIDIDFIKEAAGQLKFDTLMTIDGDTISVGAPTLQGKTVVADVLETQVKGDKVLAIRYKSKKRVHKIRGHRQDFTRVLIKKID